MAASARKATRPARGRTPEPAPLVIEARGVRKSFGKVQGVDGVDLEIRRGEFTALLGPNGAGKTTLVEMIEGIQVPDSGEIRILGLHWRTDERELRHRIGVALQETRFYEKITVSETLELFAALYGSSPSRCGEILGITRLSEKARTYTVNLSGGQRQRLALGVALINEPELLLLDEPTTGLDPNARREVWNILLELKQRDVTVILTTHYMEEAEFLCDRVWIMDRGRLLAGGDLAQLLRDQAGGDIIEFAFGGSPKRFERLKGALRVESTQQGRVRIVVRELRDALPALWRLLGKDSARLEDLVCRRRNLDDVFTDLTGRRLSEDS